MNLLNTIWMKLRLYILGISVFLLLLAALFSFGELLLRYSILQESTESRDHVSETFYMPVKLKTNYQGVFWGILFNTNHYGFRDEPNFEKIPKPDVHRILSLGDSIGFGLGIPASAHYTKVLERRLNEKEPSHKFHIVNAAGQGYSPSSYYVYLKHEGLELRPKMVIVDIEMCSVITNEALLHWETDPEDPDTPLAVRGGRYLVSWDGRLLATYSQGGYFFEKTYLYTNLLRRFLNLMYRLSPTAPFRDRNEKGISYYDLGFDRYILDEARLESGWKKTFRALKATHTLLQSNRIPFLLMIMPSRHMFNEHAGRWRAHATKLMERGIWEARRLAIPFLEFTEAIAKGGGKKLYFDFAHITEEGNRAVGDALFEHIQARFDLNDKAANQARVEAPISLRFQTNLSLHMK